MRVSASSMMQLAMMRWPPIFRTVLDLSGFHFLPHCCVDETSPLLNTMFARTRALARSLKPLGDRVLVRRAPKEVQTASGIYLPTDKTKDPNEGEIIAVGPGEKDMNGILHAVSLTTGDKVLLPEYGGTKVKIGEDELFLFRESDLLGKFE